MSWLWYFYAVVCVLAALRLRKRLKAIAVVPHATASTRSDDALLTAEGIAVGASTRDTASSWAAAQHLELVDILPLNIGVLELMRLFDRVDPIAYRVNRIGIGYTAGYALLASGPLLARTGITPGVAESLYSAARAGDLYYALSHRPNRSQPRGPAGATDRKF